MKSRKGGHVVLTLPFLLIKYNYTYALLALCRAGHVRGIGDCTGTREPQKISTATMNFFQTCHRPGIAL